ncbi:MAG: Type fimbrial assembly protein PilC [Acidimicrobiia bacterium]|nr:Type fimbrial assembly protein PilC [Acidimicrobiia bacterium]
MKLISRRVVDDALDTANTISSEARGAQAPAPKPAKQKMLKADKPPKAPKAKKPAGDKPKKSILKYELTAKKVKPAELMNFSRQAASFIRAGIPLLDALSTIAEDMEDKLLKKILDDVADRLRRGTSLADGIANYSKAFPGYYVPMLRSAELTGRLDEVLDQLAAYLGRDIESKRKVKSALTYPTVIAAMAVLTVVAMALFVLPQFKSFFASLGAKLPISTRMLLAVTNAFSAHGKQMGEGTVAFVVVLFLVLKTNRGKMRKDRILLRIPSLGKVIRFAIVERFCRILSVMVQAGVPLPDAMTVAIDCTNNRLFQKRLTVARNEMIRGGGLARPIIATGLFPSAANQMMRVGESTGTLDQQLQVASDFLGTELDYRLKKFTDMFEPIIIVAMGLVVGFVAVALVQAMYGVYSQSKV